MKSILDDASENWAERVDFGWLDEIEDPIVDNTVKLIGEGFVFCKEMFKGCGLTDPDFNH